MHRFWTLRLCDYIFSCVNPWRVYRHRARKPRKRRNADDTKRVLLGQPRDIGRFWIQEALSLSSVRHVPQIRHISVYQRASPAPGDRELLSHPKPEKRFQDAEWSAIIRPWRNGLPGRTFAVRWRSGEVTGNHGHTRWDHGRANKVIRNASYSTGILIIL